MQCPLGQIYGPQYGIGSGHTGPGHTDPLVNILENHVGLPGSIAEEAADRLNYIVAKLYENDAIADGDCESNIQFENFALRTLRYSLSSERQEKERVSLGAFADNLTGRIKSIESRELSLVEYMKEIEAIGQEIILNAIGERDWQTYNGPSIPEPVQLSRAMEFGKILAAYTTINDHIRDRNMDIATGRYNPIQTNGDLVKAVELSEGYRSQFESILEESKIKTSELTRQERTYAEAANMIGTQEGKRGERDGVLLGVLLALSPFLAYLSFWASRQPTEGPGC